MFQMFIQAACYAYIFRYYAQRSFCFNEKTFQLERQKIMKVKK